MEGFRGCCLARQPHNHLSWGSSLADPATMQFRDLSFKHSVEAIHPVPNKQAKVLGWSLHV